MKKIYYFYLSFIAILFCSCINIDNYYIEPQFEVTYSKAYVDVTYSTGSTYYYLISEITNKGTDSIYLDTGSMELCDSNGNIIGNDEVVYPYPNVIKPNEKGYMQCRINTNKNYGNDVIAVPHFNVPNTTESPKRYPVSSVNMTDTISGIKIFGHVENNTKEKTSGVKVAIVLYDENNIPLGIATDYIISIPKEQNVGFEAFSLDIPEKIKVDNVKDYICYAYDSFIQ